MQLIPFVRMNRAISACLINPDHPIQSIAISEFASVILPMLNPKVYTKIIGLMYSFIYAPSYVSEYFNYHQRINLLYYQAEICTSLLFILTLFLQHINY